LLEKKRIACKKNFFLQEKKSTIWFLNTNERHQKKAR